MLRSIRTISPVALAAFLASCGAQPGTGEAVAESVGQASVAVAQNLLNGSTIPQFVEPLPTFTGKRVNGNGFIQVSMEEIRQKVLPASYYAKLAAPYNGGALLWGYNVAGTGASWPGTTVEVTAGQSTIVHYVNNLQKSDGSPPALQPYLSQDLTMAWADPIGVSAANGCVQGVENGGVNGAVTGGNQQAFDPNGPCGKPYSGPIATAPHLHGGEVLSAYDGQADAWFTPGLAQVGPGFVGSLYAYPNQQEATALWFHDHSLGITRLNVYSGLSAFYLIRDSRDTGKTTNPITLPGGKYEQELLIADRIFDTNGQLIFPDGSLAAGGSFNGYNGAPGNKNLHPFAIPETFGDVITVNGKSWPYFTVEPRRYRFRVVNGSNARFLSMQLSQEGQTNGKWNGLATSLTDALGIGLPGPHIWQIGSDGGLLNKPTDVDALRLPNTTALLNTTPDPSHLFMAPAERADVIIDFSTMAGKRVVLTNSAVAPFPNGGATVEMFPGPDGSPQTTHEITSQVMEFRVGTTVAGGTDNSFDPAGTHPALRSQPIPDLTVAAMTHPDQRRQLVLDEVEDVTTGAPVEVMLNNSHWDGLREGTTKVIPGSSSNVYGRHATEAPRVGATELWEIANMTPDAHPIHIHLVEFQEVEVQPFLSEHGLCDQFSQTDQNFAGGQEYRAAWDGFFPGGTFNGYTFAAKQFAPGYGPPLNYTTPNADGALGGNPAFSMILNGVATAFISAPVKPAPRDQGWKDTVKLFPCAVTRLAVRIAPQSSALGSTKPGKNDFPFDPTTGGPGYAWHCHIIDHEDNEMMRPMPIAK